MPDDSDHITATELARLQGQTTARHEANLRRLEAMDVMLSHLDACLEELKTAVAVSRAQIIIYVGICTFLGSAVVAWVLGGGFG